MPVEFIQHNIRLADGTETRPGSGPTMDRHPWFLAAKRVLDAVFPGDKSKYRIADLGCLEGGYATEFARMGFQSFGLDVRETNIAACEHVKARTGLTNLEFVRDDAWNVAKYGPFDAIFCCGLFYHLDRPKQYLQQLSNCTRRLLILQTHFSTAEASTTSYLPSIVRKVLARGGAKSTTAKYILSPMTEHDTLRGRWYTEFWNDQVFKDREKHREASWDNIKSFWVQREDLIQAIRDVGFDCVLEQFDGLGTDIRDSMLSGYYHQHSRGTFLGLKPAT
jgi:2-polyprenyl-3-methyl-5-hydroxy-6-metoxy-1,4-benzoquinol methylase